MAINKKGFTLAEVLITLAIIGVVAALAIPSVISNSQQQEFKTGLKKAISVLNSAISMNIAVDCETPYDNANLFGYLTKHMSVMKTTRTTPWYSTSAVGAVGTANTNSAFYTTDGMRFEFELGGASYEFLPLHETNEVTACTPTISGENCGGCGSLGLKHNPDKTTKPPCAILVDVNGDRKPTPGNINCTNASCIMENQYKVPVPETKKVGDLFTILITESRAIPYGITAQKVLYGAQK